MSEQKIPDNKMYLPGKVTTYDFRQGGKEEERSVGVYGPVTRGENHFYVLSLVRPLDPEVMAENGTLKPLTKTYIDKEGRNVRTEMSLSREGLLALIVSAKAKLSEVPR